MSPSDNYVDFGSSARDYVVHRPGFPDLFFERVREMGLALPGQSLLDLGTGTGTLARGFASRGCRVVASDISSTMLEACKALGKEQELLFSHVQSDSAALAFRDESFELVCAGQCWHWFEPAAAASEACRVLRPGGRALLAGFTYLSDPGTPGELADSLLLRMRPDWKYAFSDGRSPGQVRELEVAGFRGVTVSEFVVDVPFTHESFRGRFRACNGVIQLLPEQREIYDRELARLLQAEFPGLLSVAHRIYMVVGERPTQG